MLPPVPTGKLVIAGVQLDDYLAALEHAVTAHARCRSRLTALTTACGHALATTYSPQTVRKHTHDRALQRLALRRHRRAADRGRDQGMGNSPFRRWYTGKVWDQTDMQELRLARTKGCPCLDQHQGIGKPQVLAALT